MRKLVILALVGLAAQLVDGSLGMGYGVTSATLLQDMQLRGYRIAGLLARLFLFVNGACICSDTTKTVRRQPSRPYQLIRFLLINYARVRTRT